MDSVDRRTLAKIRKCKSKDGYLNGAGCTNACIERDSCRIPRISLMVYTVNFKVKHPSIEMVGKVPTICFEVSGGYNPESYINEFSGGIN